MADSKLADATSSQDFDESTRYFGRVKWFNNKAGYGFCTVVGDEGEARVGEDVFVHHSGVKVASEQYKYLVQGEYVDFVWCETPDSDHEYQAGDVRGVGGNMLLCETRQAKRETRQERGHEHLSDRGSDRGEMRVGGRDERRPVRVGGEGRREGEEWMLVRRKVPGGAGKQWNKGRRQN